MNGFNDYLYRDDDRKLHYVTFYGSDKVDILVKIVPQGYLSLEERSMVKIEMGRIKEKILREQRKVEKAKI